MDSLQPKIPVNTMTAYFGIFKEPRGFIRVLQFIFAIFAFATACNGGSSFTIPAGSSNPLVSASWSYPYDLTNTPFTGTYNATDSQNVLSFSNDIKSSAIFFVFTGVTSMLLSLGFIVLYVLFDRQYRNDERFPIIDLIITLIWTIFWIAGSSAWAQGVSNIRSDTSCNYVESIIQECQNQTLCTNCDNGTYANVTVSVIFGFLNFLLWLGCIWFVYKETKFFKSRTAQQQQPQHNNFSNITDPNMQQPRVPGTIS